MQRRSFILMALMAPFVFLSERLAERAERASITNKESGAVFRVEKVDPEGSGMDYHGHEGHLIFNARRCCKNCTMVFAAWEPGGDNRNAGFIWSELKPMNNAAALMYHELIHKVYRNKQAKSTMYTLAG